MTGRDDDLIEVEEVARMVAAATVVCDKMASCVDPPSDLVNDVCDDLVISDPCDDDGEVDGIPNAVADVGTGVRLGRKAGEIGGHVFTATWSDSDDRAFHWYFVAKDREEVLARVGKALERFLPRD